MRHVYRCPMRWADLDLLGHVNNVVYVDYLQEARVDLMRAHAPDTRSDDLAEGVVVVRHEVDFVTPLEFRFSPVSIDCWVTQLRAASFTMAYEVYDQRDDERVTYLRAETVLTPYVFASERPRRLTEVERSGLEAFLEPAERPGRPSPPGGGRNPEGHYPVHVRFSDVDVYGHVNNVKYFEYFQEARIALLAGLLSRARGAAADPLTRTVVARTEVDYRIPILFRPEPYDLWSRIVRVGRTSMVIESEICDGETVLSRARVVLVFWDAEAGRPVPPPEDYRGVLEAALAGLA